LRVTGIESFGEDGRPIARRGTMKRLSFVCGAALWVAAGAFASGCVAHAQAGGGVDAQAPVVFAEPPTLVEVDADVWVVRDADYPVYYVDNNYWVYRDGVWWRSAAYDQGWAKIEVTVVPAVIVHRDHHAYVRYHGAPTARTRPGPREHLAADRDHHPPGHDEIPGVGNQRRAEEGDAKQVKNDEHHDHDERADRNDHDDKKEKNEKNERNDKRGKDDKKDKPKKK
jgi:hypothetical protein